MKDYIRIHTPSADGLTGDNKLINHHPKATNKTINPATTISDHRQWSATLPIDLPSGNEPIQSNLPGNEEFTEILIAENAGLINLSRKFGASESRKLLCLNATKNMSTSFKSNYAACI